MPLSTMIARTSLPHIHASPDPLNKPNTPYGLPIIEDCVSCVVRDSGFFCGISQSSLTALDEIKYTTSYPQGGTALRGRTDSSGCVYPLRRTSKTADNQPGRPHSHAEDCPARRRFWAQFGNDRQALRAHGRNTAALPAGFYRPRGLFEIPRKERRRALADCAASQPRLPLCV